MSGRLLNDPRQSGEPRRADMWRAVLASVGGRFVLGELIETLTRGDISAGNSDIHKNAARVDFARWIETQIGQIDPGALIEIHAVLIRMRFGRNHGDTKKETEEEET